MEKKLTQRATPTPENIGVENKEKIEPSLETGKVTFKAKDGQDYHIADNYGDSDNKGEIMVKDAQGNQVANVEVYKQDGFYKMNITSRIKQRLGIASALYDYVDNKYGNIQQSFNSEDGAVFWKGNTGIDEKLSDSFKAIWKNTGTKFNVEFPKRPQGENLNLELVEQAKKAISDINNEMYRQAFITNPEAYLKAIAVGLNDDYHGITWFKADQVTKIRKLFGDKISDIALELHPNRDEIKNIK